MPPPEGIILGLLGAAGRTGSVVRKSTPSFPGIRGALFHTRNATNAPAGEAWTDNLERVFQETNVVADFSHHSRTQQHLDFAKKMQRPLLLGVTGFPFDIYPPLEEVAQHVPILFAPNTSLGANLLFTLAKIAAHTLPNTCDIHITDIHHKHKKDAPSGTALTLKQHVLQGIGEATPSKNINIESVRTGDTPGQHKLLLKTPNEEVTLAHTLDGREALALGALKAITWLSSKPAGLYSMQDVLETKQVLKELF